MGVPKFFRYISERYPCLSEVVKEHQIPEFDNLYLDMNGIIHVCSHPNDNDPHFRISEENIIKDIFHYIETLFRLIQPQRLFFMAVDGVAPRAKMNQQRGRRFRTAKDMEMQEAKAKANNETLPDAERFDSNCITPGTVFMSRLHAQLKYFVNYKISTDKLWQKPTVILSGHETPGEGEHKIMDYIRYMKSQANYDPNTRHCLYGLDADLIMLGLCTHEPHFSLLREEVKFGKSSKDKKRASVPEEIKFYLLHLSLMREYIDLEFQQLKTTVSFPYNLENIIDDWVLMGFLVGNDFIPHLPNLHINSGALPLLYKAYIEILPELGGYINEGGSLNLPRFQKYLEKLGEFDLNQFIDTYADLKYFMGKTGRRPNEKERTSYKNSGNDENCEKSEKVQPAKNSDLAALIQSTENMFIPDDNEEGENDENGIYYSSDEEDSNAIMFAEFYQHKNDYYVNKLEYKEVTPEVLRSQAEGYVRAIQWNLNYYYNGCCSWSWFYPHHYAPFISDITNFKDLKLEFELGEPFLPFQQLLAVLPAGSKTLLPEPFQELMVNEDSPIINFYPAEFKTDMNGKRQEWEAVVLIPFINQEALLEAMASKYDRLTDEEKRRNSHGPMLVYNYTPENQGVCEAPDYFPTLNKCYAKEVPLNREDIFVDQSKLVKGLCPGVRLDVYFPGFPTLMHLEFTGALKKSKVKVFQHNSQGENMILTLKKNPDLDVNLLEIAMKFIDRIVFVNWPHLLEAKVVAVANEQERVIMKQSTDGSSSLVSEELTSDFVQQWRLSKKFIEETYFNKMGVECNETKVLLYACILEGRKYVYSSGGRVSYEKKWVKTPSTFALQAIVYDIAVKEPDFNEHLTIDELFKPSMRCFTLDTNHYGAMGTVLEGGKNGRIKLSVCITPEPDFKPAVLTAQHCRSLYMPGHIMAQRLGISSHLLSRITGSIFVVDVEPGSSTESIQKKNIGLNLKFTKRNEKVCGYTMKENGQWLYSTKAEQLIHNYMRQAPDIISYIGTNATNDIYHVQELFPEEGIEGLKKLITWLSEQDFARAEKFSCNSEIAEDEVVSVIEEIINVSKNKIAKTVVMQIKPHLLLVPKTSAVGLPPDSNAKHRLFDRIICVRESFTVPLGLKGTIIGVHPSIENKDDVTYDIVFDKEFVGGIQIRCSNNRGYRMSSKGFLNLSYGLSLENYKAKNNPVMSVQQSESDSHQWSNQRSSAFASCNNKNNYPHNRQREQMPSSQIDKQRIQLADNFLPKFSVNSRKVQNQDASQTNTDEPSSEFQAMWDELKKAGNKPVNQVSQPVPSPSPSADASDVLKKMLKIAGTSPKGKLNTNHEGVPQSREEMQHKEKIILSTEKPESATKQLENYLIQCGVSKPVYTYEYTTCDGKTLITSKVFFEVPPEVEKTFTGKPSIDISVAAESAAFAALTSLKLEEDLNLKTNKESTSKTPVILSSSSSSGNGGNDNPYNSGPSVMNLRRPTYPPGAYSMQNKISALGPPPLMGFNNGGRQQMNSYQHQQHYRNNGNKNGHRLNNPLNNWYNPDLPTPPQQWYQNNRQPLQKKDGRQFHQQQHQYYSNSHQQLPHQYQNYPSQWQNSDVAYQNFSNVPNWKVRPMAPLVGQTPFIPLQAITQCRTRPSSCSNFISKNQTSQSNQYQGPSKAVIDGSSTTDGPSSSNQSRPPTVLSQPRRSRIAANFNVKIE